jgi:isoleucyl-tRNA synthetase
MPEIDRLALHHLETLKERVLRAYEELEFHIIYQAVNAFCSVELSAIYLDILKDRLYTSRKDSLERQSAQTAIYHILDALVRMVAPVLSFTADEVWQSMPGQRKESVHLTDFPALTPEVKDDALATRWMRLFTVRAEVLKALELARAQKTIGHPLDAAVTISAPTEELTFLRENAPELKMIFIVSKVELVEEISGESYEPADLPGYRIAVTPATGDKCERCWCYDEEIGADSDHPTICPRCVAAVK